MKTAYLTTPPMKSSDIMAGQRLLVSRGFLPTQGSSTDGVFGPQTAEACGKAHTHYGFLKGRQTMGDRLIRALLKDAPLTPVHKVIQIIRKPTQTAKQSNEDKLRLGIVSYLLWGIKNEPQIHYAQTRPMEGVKSVASLYQLPRSADCSEFVTDAYASARAPDPNGLGYNGLGYTGTMLQSMRHITLSQVKLGDLVVFGDFPGHHVCGVIGLDSPHDPQLASHGQEKGPMSIRFSDEARYQPHQVHWLTVF